MVDSNILFSGLLFKGKPSKILKLAEKRKIEIVIPEDELREMYDVFQRKVSYKIYLIDILLKTIKPKVISYKRYTKLIPKALELIRDKKDAPLLACALAVKPNYFITGDKDFHTKNIKKEVNITTPSLFLKEKF
jgi:putative PIN family toxin of toxin-antitoxin system